MVFFLYNSSSFLDQKESSDYELYFLSYNLDIFVVCYFSIGK